MQRVLLAGASLLAVIIAVQQAAAADAPVPYKAPPSVAVAPVFNWSGLYAGLDAGYHWTRVGVSDPNTPAIGTAVSHPDSFTLGGHIGWRHQFSGAWVAGIEADLSWLDGSDSGIFPGAPAIGYRVNTNWDASLRGILGMAANRTLFYITGGWSWVDGNGCGFAIAAPSVCIPTTNISDTLDGWTFGAGIAHAYSDNLIVRVEYLHADYGSSSYARAIFPSGIGNVAVKSNKIRVGLSWKFDSGKAPVVTKY